MNLIQVLWDYVNKTSPSFFSRYHNFHYQGKSDPDLILRKFLFSTMDEVRLRSANKFTKVALEIVDMDDLMHLKNGLMRREINGEISYSRQRDHSSHTLYNYIMGWFIYENSRPIRDSILSHFEIRGWKKNDQWFANIWPFVSLVHDLGYLFEGKIDPLETSIQSDQVRIGVEVVNDFFNHHFWVGCDVNPITERDRIKKMANLIEPKIRFNSMTTVADDLRYLGNLEKLREAIHSKRAKRGFPVPNPDLIGVREGLSGDSFLIWKQHYEYYNLPSMVKIIEISERLFESLMSKGLGSTGIRLLDHGVCSGLLLLLYSTYYFNIYFGLDEIPPTDHHEKKTWQKFRNESVPDNVEYDPLWWWSSIVWATAATSIHNIILMQNEYPEEIGPINKLKYNEDPLAYLGVLVDCLQEWDRPTVSRESIIGGYLPLQGVDTMLSIYNNKVLINYQNNRISNKVKENLNSSLLRWDEIVTII